MESYVRIAWEDRGRRRTAMDALEVLRAKAGFQNSNQAEFHVLAFRLPSGETVGLVDLWFEQASCKTTVIVSLPTSSGFHAVQDDTGTKERFEIERLDRARIDASGNTQLTDRTKVRAIEVSPALLPTAPTDLDWRIVHLTLELMDARDSYRRLHEHLPEHLRVGVADEYYLDCSKLAGLTPPLLKMIQGFIADRDPTLRRPSPQQIANSLEKFGMRIPRPRPRKPSASVVT